MLHLVVQREVGNFLVRQEEFHQFNEQVFVGRGCP